MVLPRGGFAAKWFYRDGVLPRGGFTAKTSAVPSGNELQYRCTTVVRLSYHSANITGLQNVADPFALYVRLETTRLVFSEISWKR